ncbi:MAG: radical SAM family heme chaperone HemW [Kiritimatiellae bacterium]|nr:radical SAM family heme chaperone HemW [Kiritimatiellia bacterium]
MNLYVHFPFCRAKCAYCALRSKAGSSSATRRNYCKGIAAQFATLPTDTVATVYFGGGSPALCDLEPILDALRQSGARPVEFTVELHPLDATGATLNMLREGGVNRISLGVQSLDDGVLESMGRLHTAAQAEKAFRAIRAAGFRNAGIDLIAGWPGTSPKSWSTTLARATALGLDHCSVYTLIREPNTRLDLAARKGRLAMPSDDAALAQIDEARAVLADAGLVRYEISNYARPGFECRHNLAVWRGEDYIGLGDGACGRVGLTRTDGDGATHSVTPEEDAVERALFALRTSEGLSLESAARRWPVLAPRIPSWRETLEFFKRQGLLQDAYRLTVRGAEVCDSILAELV